MLDSLQIQNFRSLADFRVEKLGRVNLVVGRNNSGKSSVLEALRIHAGNAQRSLLEALADEHEERSRPGDEDLGEADDVLPFQDFFTGRAFPQDDRAILIGTLNDPEPLRIQHVFLDVSEETLIDELGQQSMRLRRRTLSRDELADYVGEPVQALQISRGNRSYPSILLDAPETRRFRTALHDLRDGMPCSVVPTRFVSFDDLADDWDRIVFTEHEHVLREAMRIVDPDFEDLTFVRSRRRRAGFQRTAMVKMRGVARPVPLGSMGDGMLRVLQLILRLFPARGGILLIDEFENGLHYSVMEKIWALLFDMADRLDIQIFATTHSWDCIESFARVAIERQEIEGVLFRMGRSARASNRGQTIATVFDEEALFNITQSDVEVR